MALEWTHRTEYGVVTDQCATYRAKLQAGQINLTIALPLLQDQLPEGIVVQVVDVLPLIVEGKARPSLGPQRPRKRIVDEST